MPGNAELAIKFFDYLEANADEYWEIPSLDGVDIEILEEPDDAVVEAEAIEEEDEDDEEKSIFAAAYEDVTFRDSTDDDVEGTVVDQPGPDQPPSEIDEQTDRVERRLKFHATLAKLWTLATRLVRARSTTRKKHAPGSFLKGWTAKARDHFQGMLKFMDVLHDYAAAETLRLLRFARRVRPQPAHEGTARWASRSRRVPRSDARSEPFPPRAAPIDIRDVKEGPAWEPHLLRLERALLQQKPDVARSLLPAFMKNFHAEPLLYRPLHQGGHPRPILRANIAQTILRGLVGNLPPGPAPRDAAGAPAGPPDRGEAGSAPARA